MDKIRSLIIILIGIAALIYAYYSLTYWDQDYLGRGIWYNEDWEVIFVNDKGIPNVPPKVVDYDWNSKHIIVKQRPYQFAPDFNGWRNIVYPNGYDTTYYWLIVKSEHLFIGPLDSTDFDVLRQEYNVSNKLTFNH